jgi:hypothetical protein
LNFDKFVKSRQNHKNVIPVGRLIGSQREPLRKLGDSASKWKPLQKLDKVERPERPDLNKRLPGEVERKPESRNFNKLKNLWTPVFTGVTTFYDFINFEPHFPVIIAPAAFGVVRAKGNFLFLDIFRIDPSTFINSDP